MSENLCDPLETDHTHSIILYIMYYNNTYVCSTCICILKKI